jgi:hypothetical protein
VGRHVPPRGHQRQRRGSNGAAAGCLAARHAARHAAAITLADFHRPCDGAHARRWIDQYRAGLAVQVSDRCTTHVYSDSTRSTSFPSHGQTEYDTPIAGATYLGVETADMSLMKRSRATYATNGQAPHTPGSLARPTKAAGADGKRASPRRQRTGASRYDSVRVLLGRPSTLSRRLAEFRAVPGCSDVRHELAPQRIRALLPDGLF